MAVSIVIMKMVAYYAHVTLCVVMCVRIEVWVIRMYPRLFVLPTPTATWVQPTFHCRHLMIVPRWMQCFIWTGWMNLCDSGRRVPKQFHLAIAYESVVDPVGKEWLRAISYEGKNVKGVSVTGCGSPYGCKTSRLPHFLDNRLTDGGKVSLTHRPPLSLQKSSWYSFLLEAESTPGL
jgi:hypothetical protein